ncbi:MAG TPA: Trk system potassium transporter TrkA [Desulfobacterales bacterium]|nr:Trk system potassium transporter TrkA [Desulfobacterales bacterium]
MKVVIVGAGEVGFQIASRLSLENKEVVVIDKSPVALRRVSDNIDVQVLNGSGSSPVVLEEAGIKEAEILLAVTDSDETNLVACLVANMVSPATKKMARLRNADYDKYHETFRKYAPHIDTVINPEIEVIKTIERLMNVSGAMDIGEFTDSRVKFIGIHLEKENSLTGVRLSELAEKTQKHSPLIAAIIREDELIIPRGDDVLMPGDIVYCIIEEKNLPDTMRAFNKESRPLHRVLIVGGGRIGFRLATILEEKSVLTKIIEKNPDRCAELAEKLGKTVVLHGDGSDQSLLSEENVQEMDVVVTLTNEEEINILASLLAKRMGARKTITKISKLGYLPLMSTIGIEQVVSPRLSAINSFLQHIRRGKVLSAIAIKGEQAEFMEAAALETSDIVGRPLKNISFPKGALVTSIIRKEEVMIPSGESVIQPGDRVIIFARRTAIPKIENILSVKLEYF